MKLFSFLKGKSPETQGAQKTEPCTHPPKFQTSLYEDGAHPNKVTAYKCSRCGARVPLPVEPTKPG